MMATEMGKPLSEARGEVRRFEKALDLVAAQQRRQLAADLRGQEPP